MRRLMIFMAFLIVVPAAFSEVKVSYIAGDVSVLKDNQWSAAVVGTVLDVNNKIKTSSKSQAILSVNEKTQVWVNEESQFSVSSTGQDSFFDILAGKVRAKVQLAQGQKFRIKTPVSVASVRGTDFILTFEGILAVLEGKIEFSDAMMKQVVEVLENQFGEPDKKGGVGSRTMTGEEKAQIELDWKAFADYLKTTQAEKNADELREEIHQIVREVRSDIEITRELMNEIKEADIAAGRTLRDVHGNLVRVEQVMIRPDSNTMQILNLTKRTEYSYKDHGMGVSYSGPSGNRLDVVDVTMKMNQKMPEQLSEWPSFITSQGDNLHPDTVNFRITNMKDSIESKGTWQKKGFIDGAGQVLKDDQLTFTHYINGWKVDDSYKAYDDPNLINMGKEIKKDGHGNGDLWQWMISPDQKIQDPKDPTHFEFVNLYEESYVINNGGGIMNLNSFANSSENPFVLLKQVGAEQIVFCRYASDPKKDFFAKGNIDAVIVPDVFVAAALQMVSTIGELNKSSDKSSNSSSKN